MSEAASQEIGPTPQKRPRRINYTPAELEILTDEVTRHHATLFASFTLTITQKLKNNIWDSIANKMNAVSSAHRTADEIRRKWNEMKCRAKKKAQDHRKEIAKTGGGEILFAVKSLSEVEEKVVSLIPKCQIEGIVGGEESGGYESVSATDPDVTISAHETARSSILDEASATPESIQQATLPDMEDCNTRTMSRKHKPRKPSPQETATSSILDIEMKKLEAMKAFFDSMLSIEAKRLALEERRLAVEEEKVEVMKSSLQVQQTTVHSQTSPDALSVSPIIKLLQF